MRTIDLLVTIGVLACNPACTLAAASDAQYNTVIEQARRGDTGPALELLKAWTERYPGERQYLYDYAVVLVWAGEADTAMDLWSQLDRPDTPDYVLFSLARAARGTRHFVIGEAAYRRVLQHAPRDPQATGGLALTMADDGQTDAALDHIRSYLQTEPRPYGKNLLPLLHARGYVEQRKGQYVDATETYAEALAISADDEEALRERVFVTARLGAAHLALAYAARDARLFSDAELERLHNEAVGSDIRWGEAQLAHDPSPARYTGIDRALAESEPVECGNCSREKSPGGPEPRQLFNRMLALRDRLHMLEVIGLYQYVLRQGIELPAYALAAAADAYLYEYQPAEARDLYQRSLNSASSNRSTPDREWVVGLVYAYMACGQFAEARKLADNLVVNEPPYVNRGVPGVQVDNFSYIQARHLQALERLLEDRLDESQQLLTRFLISAPYNIAARTSVGTLLFVREKPRAAEEQFRSVLVDEPRALDARIGYAQMLLALHEYSQAEAAIDELIRYEPLSRGIQRAEHDYDVYQRPQVIMEGTDGSTKGAGISSVTGTHDYGLDTRIYSAPIAYRWRIYARHYYAEALFDNVASVRNRTGIGGEYRARVWEATAEVDRNTGTGFTGLSTAVTWTPSDDWSVRGALSTDSDEVPLKAHLAAIEGRDYQISLTRTVNESRHFDVGGMYVDFTDGNQRKQWHAEWFERLRSGPVYKLDTTLRVDGSANTISGAPYFNPRNDIGADLEMINEWLTWRTEWRTFKQRMIALAGVYQQPYFGTRPIWGIRYEHEWAAAGSFRLRYGIGHVQHPYDGAQQGLDSFYFNLNWLF